jgi:Divergent InlB B-repeat domain
VIVKRALVVLVCSAGVVLASSASARTLHYQVTVVVSGPGHVTAPAPDPTSGSIDCPTTCSALMKQNSTVVFTAAPDAGDTFSGWGGACASAGTATTCTITFTGQGSNGSTSITAGFGVPPPPAQEFELTVTKTGTGHGFVGGGGIDCGTKCSVSLTKGTKMTLLAVPNPGSAFLGWSGACSGPTCTVVVKRSATVAVTFADRRRPYVVALPERVKRGRPVNLQFRAWDATGRSREVLTVRSGASVLVRDAVPLRRVTFRRLISVAWKIPVTARLRSDRLCVTAFDRAGRRSPASCAVLSVF